MRREEIKTKSKTDIWDVILSTETIIMILLLLLLFLVGCDSLGRIAKPQSGGHAMMRFEPQAREIVIDQPENAATPSISEYNREMVPVWFFHTNMIGYSNHVGGMEMFAMRESYKTTLGEHQKDTAREGFVGVQRAAAMMSKMRPIMYAGLILIVAAIAMSYFQAKYPLVFAPGLKIIALTFLTGLVLVVLPSLTQNNTFLLNALIGGVGLILAYLFQKRLSENEKNSKQ
jgi:hypothetical protein